MTIQEIARLAGVSTATVSRVFNHHPSIRPELREQVLAVARLHGYLPRLAARQRNVVIITPYDSLYPVQSCVDMILMALMGEFPKRDFRLEILPVNNLERLANIQFCGAVAIGAEAADFTDWNERFHVPLVIVDRDSARTPRDVYFVRSDEAQGMDTAIAHLFERGCRKIGCIIHGDPGVGNADIRFEAIKSALRRRKLPAGEQFIHFSGPGPDKYVEIIGKLLQLGVDSLFCPGGNAGIVGLYALSLFNRKVPADISLLASEQTFFSRHAVPPQSTITPDYTAIAAAVADVIEKRCAGDPVVPKTVLPYQLISRESVRFATET